MTCPPCNNNCRQGRDCPSKGAPQMKTFLLFFAAFALIKALVIFMQYF
jgi:hypothetical protein